MLEQGQQTAVKRPPPHFINSPATSLGYLECDLGAGSKVLSLSPNKQPRVAGVQLLRPPSGPRPLPSRAPSLGSLINWRLLQATPLLISTIISVWRDGPAPPGRLSASRPLRDMGKPGLATSERPGRVPWDCSAKWLWVWGDCPGLQGWWVSRNLLPSPAGWLSIKECTKRSLV